MPYKRFRISEDQLDPFLDEHKDFKKRGGIVFGRLGSEYFFRPHQARFLSKFNVKGMEEVSGGTPLDKHFQECDGNYEKLQEFIKTTDLWKAHIKMDLSFSQQAELGKEYNLKSGELYIYFDFEANPDNHFLHEEFKSLVDALRTWVGGFVEISAVHVPAYKVEFRSQLRIYVADMADFDRLYSHFVNQINKAHFNFISYHTHVSSLRGVWASKKTVMERERLCDPETKTLLRSKIQELWQ